jgi:hypothetical protein
MHEVTFTATITAEQAEQLAQFAKRSTFETFYQFTEAHFSRTERQALARSMIDGMEAVQRALADAGFNPR